MPQHSFGEILDNYEIEEPTSTRKTHIHLTIKGSFMHEFERFFHNYSLYFWRLFSRVFVFLT